MTEILAPAGDLEKLKYAVIYGANCVYLAGRSFGMRANAGNFSIEEMVEGIEFAHSFNCRVFVTVNIAARNYDLDEIKRYVKQLSDIHVDGLIIADPGVIRIVKETIPDMFITLSTQANTTNVESVRFWADFGINRVVLARELSFNEIRYICQNRPKGIQIETFIHGAMCISYSGRCLLSNYMAGRDSNRGDCAQPCRWKYYLREDTRKDELFEIQQDERGTYVFNSKDLCLIDKVYDLVEVGVDSFKIEGRMKSAYYVACVTSAYHQALERIKTDGANYKFDDLYLDLEKVSHRDYTHAFFDNSDNICQNYDNGGYVRSHILCGQVYENTNEDQYTKIHQKNKFLLGDTLDVITPSGISFETKCLDIMDGKGEHRQDACHADEELFIKTDKPLLKDSFLRKLQ